MLQLTRPLAVVDLETTGLSTASDRIVEISILKVLPDGSRELKTRRLNPEQPIPRQATAIHELSNADVAQQPAFRQIAKALFAYLDGCDLCTFNGRRFDVPLLAKEFARVQLAFPAQEIHHVDVFDLFRLLHPQKSFRTLSAAVEHYLQRPHTQAHAAEADTVATFDILQAMLPGKLAELLSGLPDLTSHAPFSPHRLHHLCCSSFPSSSTVVRSLRAQPVAQPTLPAADSQQLLAQLLGICGGILADGEVNEQEATFFANWIRRHAPAQPAWPFTDLLARVERIFADGICDAEERAELKSVMEALLDSAASSPDSAQQPAADLPLCTPAPHPIEFVGRQFVVTGKFAYGSRSAVFSAIQALGGIPTDTAPSATTTYVVVGAFGSLDWVTSSQGRKLQKAVQLRSKGAKLHIISEQHFRSYLS